MWNVMPAAIFSVWRRSAKIPAVLVTKKRIPTKMLKLPSVAPHQLLMTCIAMTYMAACHNVMAQSKTAAEESAQPPHQGAVQAAATVKEDGKRKDGKARGWQPLFEKSSLKGWKVTNYGGEGEATVTDRVLMLEQGVDLSGVTTTRKDLPTDHYEVEFEARRTQGNDFFVGFTFPVRDSSCSLICGGWGGGICGISSIDLMDASENETTSYSSFNNGQWYKIKLKVDGNSLEAWMDGKPLLEVDLEESKVDTRFEMDLSKPMGFACYQSTAEIRKARYRSLKSLPAKAEPTAKKAKQD